MAMGESKSGSRRHTEDRRRTRLEFYFPLLEEEKDRRERAYTCMESYIGGGRNTEYRRLEAYERASAISLQTE